MVALTMLQVRFVTNDSHRVIVFINAFRMDQTLMLGNKNWRPHYFIGRTIGDISFVTVLV